MPATVVKSLLRDKLEDDVLDLSLMQMDEVPVHEMSLLPKGTTVDLSNNLLVRLPENFPTLTHIIKLDLSKNRLVELPEYFGQLKNLRQLDLYSNQIERLPLSFCQLKNLKWLDLKNNPLASAVQQAAGPCITAQDCAVCAKKVVALMKAMQALAEEKRQKIAIEERKREVLRLQAENEERERVKAEKKAMKAKKKQEHKARSTGESSTPILNNSLHSEPGLEMNQVNQNTSQSTTTGLSQQSRKRQRSSGCCMFLFSMLFSILMLMVGLSLSALWIYTGGRLDQDSIERAIPVILRDVNALTSKLGQGFDDFSRNYIIPLKSKMSSDLQFLITELERRNKLAAFYINDNLGPSFCSAKKHFFHYWETFKVYLNQAWEQSRPALKELQALCSHYIKLAMEILKIYVPKLLDAMYEQGSVIISYIHSTVNNFLN